MTRPDKRRATFGRAYRVRHPKPRRAITVRISIDVTAFAAAHARIRDAFAPMRAAFADVIASVQKAAEAARQALAALALLATAAHRDELAALSRWESEGGAYA